MSQMIGVVVMLLDRTAVKQGSLFVKIANFQYQKFLPNQP